jgi:hypothetical protein
MQAALEGYHRLPQPAPPPPVGMAAELRSTMQRQARQPAGDGSGSEEEGLSDGGLSAVTLMRRLAMQVGRLERCSLHADR